MQAQSNSDFISGEAKKALKETLYGYLNSYIRSEPKKIDNYYVANIEITIEEGIEYIIDKFIPRYRQTSQDLDQTSLLLELCSQGFKLCLNDFDIYKENFNIIPFYHDEEYYRSLWAKDYLILTDFVNYIAEENEKEPPLPFSYSYEYVKESLSYSAEDVQKALLSYYKRYSKSAKLKARQKEVLFDKVIAKGLYRLDCFYEKCDDKNPNGYYLLIICINIFLDYIYNHEIYSKKSLVSDKENIDNFLGFINYIAKKNGFNETFDIESIKKIGERDLLRANFSKARELMTMSEEYYQQLQTTSVYELFSLIAGKYNFNGYPDRHRPPTTRPCSIHTSGFNDDIIALAHAYSKYWPGQKTGLELIDRITAGLKTEYQYLPKHYDYLKERGYCPDVDDKETFSKKAHQYYEKLLNNTPVFELYKDACSSNDENQQNQNLFALACGAFRRSKKWKLVPDELAHYINYLEIGEILKDYISQEIPESILCDDDEIPKKLKTYSYNYMASKTIGNEIINGLVTDVEEQVDIKNICTAAEKKLDPNLFLTICRNYFANFLYANGNNVEEPHMAAIVVDFLNYIAEGEGIAVIFTEDYLLRAYEEQADKSTPPKQLKKVESPASQSNN